MEEKKGDNPEKKSSSGTVVGVGAVICARVKQTRKEAGMTQAQFAALIKVGIPYIKGVEQRRFTPSADVLYQIAKTFKRSLNWYYGFME